MQINLKENQMRKLANFLTVARVAAIPFFIYCFFMADKNLGATIAFWIFLIASITDYLDGKIARAFNATSKFGQMLDPIADKLLVTTALILLSTQMIGNVVIPVTEEVRRADVLPVIIIILREVLVSGLREFLALQKIEMPVTKLAKWKTAVQLISLIMILGVPVFDSIRVELHQFGQLTLWLAAILTAITGIQYTRHTLKNI
jgi:cardiolipin synthase